MTQCQWKFCEAEAAETVNMKLPRQWGSDVVILDEAREQPMELCAPHAETVRLSTMWNPK